MPKLKSILTGIAKTFRAAALGLENWYWILLAACIVSPISVHVRVPYAISYGECAYVGTRGMMHPDPSECSLVALIDTRNGELVRW